MSDNMDYQLDQELLELEAQLASLVPTALPAEVTDAVSTQIDQSLIDAAMEVHDAELKDLEAHLELLAPAGISSDVLSRMSEAMDRWHEHVPVEEKVVSFDSSEPVLETSNNGDTTRKSGLNIYAAAAAVALLGAAAALVFPGWSQSTNTQLVSAEEPPRELIATTPVPAIGDVDVVADNQYSWPVPDSLSHKVLNAQDAGVVMSRDNIPHRNIRIDYIDRVKVLDQNGRVIELNRPGVRYILLPVKTN